MHLNKDYIDYMVAPVHIDIPPTGSLTNCSAGPLVYINIREFSTDLNLLFFEISSHTVFQTYCSFYCTLTSQLAGYARMISMLYLRSPFRSIPPHLQQRQNVVRALVEAFPSDLTRSWGN